MTLTDEQLIRNTRRSSARIFFLVMVLCILIAVAAATVFIAFNLAIALPDD